MGVTGLADLCGLGCLVWVVRNGESVPVRRWPISHCRIKSLVGTYRRWRVLVAQDDMQPGMARSD